MGEARFKPGKLTGLQRDYIISASSFLNGEPIPFCRQNVPYQGQHSLNGLIQRGLMEERQRSFCYLTEDGYRVAAAIHRLLDRHWEARELDAHIAALAKARGEIRS